MKKLNLKVMELNRVEFSGKTRFYVNPNLMQMHSSYCVTDPKGTIVLECGKMLEDNG